MHGLDKTNMSLLHFIFDSCNRGIKMKKRLELDMAKESAKSAFLPFQCSVEDSDDGNCILIQVFDGNGHALLKGGVKVPRKEFCDPNIGIGFPTKIGLIRACLEKHGFKLSPWAPNF
jgi:hypothetical protein